MKKIIALGLTLSLFTGCQPNRPAEPRQSPIITKEPAKEPAKEGADM